MDRGSAHCKDRLHRLHCVLRRGAGARFVMRPTRLIGDCVDQFIGSRWLCYSVDAPPK
jgi:hypothetical protein